MNPQTRDVYSHRLRFFLPPPPPQGDSILAVCLKPQAKANVSRRLPPLPFGEHKLTDRLASSRGCAHPRSPPPCAKAGAAADPAEGVWPPNSRRSGETTATSSASKERPKRTTSANPPLRLPSSEGKSATSREIEPPRRGPLCGRRGYDVLEAARSAASGPRRAPSSQYSLRQAHRDLPCAIPNSNNNDNDNNNNNNMNTTSNTNSNTNYYRFVR